MRNHDPNDNEPPFDNHEFELAKSQQSKAGKWMFLLAWVAFLLLATLWFDDLLIKKINPNTQPESYVTAQGVEVRLKQNSMGHYVTTGTINGRSVVFLLDTGATNVSIPAHLGEHLSLRPGRRVPVSTANGSIVVRTTSIDTLSVGDLALQNVSGHLNPGLQGNEILLGMSALKNLEMIQRDGWLILRSY